MALAVQLQVLPHGEGLALPAYATEHSAGVDLRAALGASVVLEAGARALIPCGICVALPVGYEAQVRPRSGLAVKHGVTVINSPGTIDADYRGELRVALVNLGDQPFEIVRGARVAQLVVAPVVQLSWSKVAQLDATARGAGGFGSTGAR